MNISIVQLYVAKKFAMRDDLFAEAQKKMNGDEYRRFVMSQKVADLPPRLIKDCERVICRKYKIKKPRYLFSHPTVRQWIFDLAKFYQADDLVDYFAQATGYPADRIRHKKIGSTVIDRPYLISLVEKLEEATGKSLLWPNSSAPLAYLGDDITYEEIARYFSYGSDIITAKRRQHAETDEPRHLLEKFRRETLKVYRLMAGVPDSISDEEFAAMPVKTVVPKNFSTGNWDLPIFWTEEKFGVQILDVPEKIKDTTKVSELVDNIVVLRYNKAVK